MRIDYSDDGDGECVVLIHGGASNNRQWKTLRQDLSKAGFRVVTPNLHGVGHTAPWQGPGPYRMTNAASLVERICAMRSGPLNVVGHSYGGVVAMHAAARLRERVERLVLLEAAPYDLLRQSGSDDEYARVYSVYEFARRSAERGDWRAMAEGFLDAFAGKHAWDQMSEERRARVVDLMRNNNEQWSALMADTTSLADWNHHLPRRTLFISALDTWSPLRELVRLFQLGCPDWSFATVPRGGHLAPFTVPELVNPLVVTFLLQ